ncbi:hypothetical protein [Tenacibaculum ascidiaceicola]|uniref:hypothetical protein n=1 Tax=Tenacibaculum ascidiaceicola TaxID=1699411 RepID=UPI003CE458E0
MKLIDKFFYFTWNPYTREKVYKGETVLRKELERPSIEFKNTDSKKIIVSNFRFHNAIPSKERIYDGVLYQNDYYSQLKFNEEEVLFLANNYGLMYKETDGNKSLSIPKEYYNEIGEKNIDDEPYINFKFLEDNDNNEYLIISFIRYPLAYPERAKDQTDPFLTYIHGIWEKPLLTDEIIDKIKKS